MFIGFTGHAFDNEKEFGLKKDETNHLSGYTFVLQNIREEERPNHYAWIADLHVSDASGKEIVMLHPEKRIYFHRNPDPERRQPHSELDIYSTMKQDIYSIFNSVDLENGVAYLKIMINPLVNWVWFGGFIFVLGTLVALWPPKKEKL